VWAHVSCGYWHQQTRFKNSDTRHPVIDVDDVDKERFKMRCDFCFHRKGAVVQCCHPDCGTANSEAVKYHVTCGLRNGVRFEMRVRDDDDDNGGGGGGGGGGGIFHHHYCATHAAASGDVDDDPSGKEGFHLRDADNKQLTCPLCKAR
jgi:hypothetical protein